MKRFAAAGRMTGFDATAITATIAKALASAGLDAGSGPMKRVTDTIENALSAAGLVPGGASGRTASPIEGSARRVDAQDAPAIECAGVAHPGIVEPSPKEVRRQQPGGFFQRSYTGSAGTRTYKVYVPGGYSSEADGRVPMVVMLHGCTQSPDDFAAGTRMNRLADEHGFIVIYPAQHPTANGQRCWNWFRPEDQLRESGEPAIIAGITREVAGAYRVDNRRIFVAGMSAGGAMALILATTHADLYAAVGVHSGLAYRAAHDVPSALKAMHAPSAPAGCAPGGIPIPAIVFHGDSDRTVNAGNAATIMSQVLAGHGDSTVQEDASSGRSAGGRSFSRKLYVNTRTGVVAEQWIVHGAGHAWSGGSTAGSFTDETGPDSSREMIRFFLALPRAGSA
jgi:poly(hydroxyalkanoate) depolymerase family esterase